ncbi:heavy metal transporter [Streptomyces sp. XM83C]|uniref:heavy metal transporter n=1 Tax=unclassified Streptomyces TaxID=2593676 RepID=UPI001FFB4EF0|nr:heavy metal transporter [Streptomyces sp. XM83C]MCK1822942.1 heavy metal transporter [Streptomyces sp. XM83C]
MRYGAGLVALCAVAGYLTVQYVTGGTDARGCKVVSGRGDGASYEFTPEQAVNAATIAAVGTNRAMPERAVTIALATALQESGLRNLNHGDRDSLGLFQQRPSQGWGTPEQIMDPTYAAGMFYKHLAKVRDYESLPLTVAAQRVQRSGYPEAYAKHEPDATLLAAALTGRSPATLTCTGRPDGSDEASDSGPDAVRAALVRDFGRGAFQEAGAEAGAGGAGNASGQASASPAPGGTTGGDGRTVTVPVASEPDGRAAGRSEAERGWQLAHWAVAHASALRIERVSYAGREWIAGRTDGQWRDVGGDSGAAGAEHSGDSVRIVTVR